MIHSAKFFFLLPSHSAFCCFKFPVFAHVRTFPWPDRHSNEASGVMSSGDVIHYTHTHTPLFHNTLSHNQNYLMLFPWVYRAELLCYQVSWGKRGRSSLLLLLLHVIDSESVKPGSKGVAVHGESLPVCVWYVCQSQSLFPLLTVQSHSQTVSYPVQAHNSNHTHTHAYIHNIADPWVLLVKYLHCLVLFQKDSINLCTQVFIRELR